LRRPMIAGNWKMNSTASEAEALVTGLLGLVADVADVDIVLAPPSVYLRDVSGLISKTPLALGAQDMFWEKSGAWTGEVSAAMLKDIGCSYVIIGHSERRQFFHETDESVNKKVLAAIEAGLNPIVCVGETLAERESDAALRCVDSQVRGALANIDAGHDREITIAYEPLWAIGTGKTASPEEAEEIHLAIRQILVELFGVGDATSMRIIYGGSVKPTNVDELMSQTNIDGALVGGASLDAESFARIVRFKANS